MSAITGYFMGANSPCGFFSIFDEIYNPYKNVHPYIIKGGPGTGKSTLMKKVAEKAQEKGCDVQLIYCSSDPKSLDAVIIDEIGVSVIDGTSPHVLEPKFPGAVENIINTGAFWDGQKLSAKSDRIRTLTLENSIYHRTSSKYLSAVGAVNDDVIRLASGFIREEKINSFAVRFVAREAPKKKNSSPGKKCRRFLSGITPDGIVYMDSTVNALATRVIGIQDEVGAVSGILCQRIGELAVRNGYDVIFCHCPLKPKGDCEHIIIPELNLAFITVKKLHNSKILCDRIIHCERFLLEGLQEYKQRIKHSQKMCSYLLDESIKSLARAKAIHDELEKEYIEVMDYEALNKFTEKIVSQMFDK